MGQVPERLINFRVYNGAVGEFIGVANVDLPPFEVMTESIAGAGIAGDYDSPVLGHFKSQVVKVSFLAPTKSQLDFFAPVRQVIDIRGSIQQQDPMLGTLTSQALRVECTGQVKSHTLGKMEPGKTMGSEFELECAVIRISLDGVPIIEIDKFNMIFKVNGVDYLAKARQDMGGV